MNTNTPKTPRNTPWCIYSRTYYSPADMRKNCGFICRSMKFGTDVDHDPGNIFRYGATMKNDCVHIGSHFSKLRVKSMKTLKI